MNRLQQLVQRLRSSFSHPAMDQELDEEMKAHLEMAIEENIKRGMSAEEAWRQAQVRLGGVEQAKQQQRNARGFQGLRYSLA